ncbi:Por secretion system C-terminal sorting domain-containing protein [Prevotella sp. ne3005]|uniref:T9SS type A sorting domain-containing protein n=1 Tax=Prevotella sp. ne3005 TaxID=1761887 RepID=UPI0008D3453C|nr:T9SS type A sorting domain-containing protein [Prevotella sp. ne3005]SEM85283.1 Por secretion system C-terminal sorting domain-containing protein [Prevotella sp. ne3005]
MDMLSTKLNNVLALLVFLTVFCVGTRAAQVETLVVKLKNGSETAFFLKDKPQVKFEGTNLKVTSSAGDTTFALADVLQFTYDKRDTSGINETVTEPTGVIFKDDVLVVSQLKVNAVVSVYGLDGILVRQWKAPHAGTFRLSLSELPSGLYLVKVDNITYKIMKR